MLKALLVVYQVFQPLYEGLSTKRDPTPCWKASDRFEGSINLIFPKRLTFDTMAYPVQRSLWEGLESVFLANARNLLRDIASDLGRPEKELLKAFTKDKLQIYLVEEEGLTKECCALQTESPIATRCRRAVYRDTCYCPLHLRTSPNSQFAYGYPQFRRIQTESGDLYFVDPISQILYTSDGTRVGLRSDKKIKVFKIEECNQDREDTATQDVYDRHSTNKNININKNS